MRPITCHRIARPQIHLDGVAVVDDAELGRPIVEADRFQIHLDAVADVDRRLALAHIA
jgi:hypothetical protein